jgi:hypothetical protein
LRLRWNKSRGGEDGIGGVGKKIRAELLLVVCKLRLQLREVENTKGGLVQRNLRNGDLPQELCAGLEFWLELKLKCCRKCKPRL